MQNTLTVVFIFFASALIVASFAIQVAAVVLSQLQHGVK